MMFKDRFDNWPTVVKELGMLLIVLAFAFLPVFIELLEQAKCTG